MNPITIEKNNKLNLNPYNIKTHYNNSFNNFYIIITDNNTGQAYKEICKDMNDNKLINYIKNTLANSIEQNINEYMPIRMHYMYDAQPITTKQDIKKLEEIFNSDENDFINFFEYPKEKLKQKSIN